MTLNKHIRVFVIACILPLLSACSATNAMYWDTLKLAFDSTRQLPTKSAILESKADLLYVLPAASGKPIIMALAFIENNNYKWISANKVIIEQHYGVISKTHGFENDLLHTTALRDNPLADVINLKDEWQRQIDIDNSVYGAWLKSKWLESEQQSIVILGETFNVFEVVERVSMKPYASFLSPELTWENKYWFDSDSKQLLKTVQKFSPESEEFTMTYLSRAARLSSPQDKE